MKEVKYLPRFCVAWVGLEEGWIASMLLKFLSVLSKKDVLIHPDIVRSKWVFLHYSVESQREQSTFLVYWTFCIRLHFGSHNCKVVLGLEKYFWFENDSKRFCFVIKCKNVTKKVLKLLWHQISEIFFFFVVWNKKMTLKNSLIAEF